MGFAVDFYFDKEGQAYDDLFKKMEILISPRRGMILKPFRRMFSVSPVRLNEVLPEVEQWSKANPDVSCWLQYGEIKNDDLSLPYDEIAVIGVREYSNGELVYSMEGSIEHKKALEPEETTIEDDRVRICKSDGKKGIYVVDGTINVDTHEQPESYYVFARSNPFK